MRTLPSGNESGASLRADCNEEYLSRVERAMVMGPVTDGANRCSRIISAAAEEAAVNGYHRLNIRSVAAVAQVSTATIYRYFPSKPRLVVAVFGHWLEEFDMVRAADPIVISDPRERLQQLVCSLFASLYRRPLFADAVGLAYALADESAADEVEGVRLHLSELFAEALGRDDFTSDDVAIGAVLCDVWLASMVGMSQCRVSPADFHQRLSTAVHCATAGSGHQPSAR